MLIRQKIHLAEIQETHYPENANYILNGYRIGASASRTPTEQPKIGMAKGGVAISVRAELMQYISKIQRIDHRITILTLLDTTNDVQVTIIATYATQK